MWAVGMSILTCARGSYGIDHDSQEDLAQRLSNWTPASLNLSVLGSFSIQLQEVLKISLEPLIKIVQVIKSCLQSDPHLRPSAAALLKYDFFTFAARSRLEREVKRTLSGPTQAVDTPSFPSSSSEQLNRDLRKSLELLQSWRFRRHNNPLFRDNCKCCAAGKPLNSSETHFCECSCHSDGSVLSQSDTERISACFRIPASMVLHEWNLLQHLH